MLCLSPRLTGLDGHLLSDRESLSLVPGPPEGAWILGETGDLSVDLLAKLSGVELSTDPPKKFLRAIEAILQDPGSDVPWNLVMPVQAFKDYVQRLLDDSWRVIDEGSACYYKDVFMGSRQFLEQLDRAKINVIEYISALREEKSDSQRTALRSFRPDTQGLAKRPTYDQTSSRTGRMTVTGGPQILTLRKDLRRIIGSRYEGGRIVQLDYISLEPRLALAISGKRPGKDVYEAVRWEALEGFLDRNATKQAILSVLYGAGWRSIKENLGITAKRSKDLRSRLLDHFDIRKMGEELVRQQMETGTIRNFYGRVLIEEEASENLLYNNFVQSSAVDVASLGFSRICDEIRSRSLPVHPLFVIHDALILDCHPSVLSELEDISHVGETIDPFDVKFYLDIGDFN